MLLSNMLVFIDETGDAGFKLGKGSSKYFVVTLIIFDNTLDAERTAIVINELKGALNFSDRFEFKFNKTDKKTKLAFFKATIAFPFRIRAIVVDKSKIKSTSLLSDKNRFYNYIVKLVLKNDGGRVLDASIKIDGSGDRAYRRAFSSYLRHELNNNQNKVKDIRFVDSTSNVLIQLADMVSGAIWRKFERVSKDKDTFYRIIENKIEDCWEFDKNAV